MNLSVIIVVVFLSTLSTLSTHHVKRRHRNNRILGSLNYETNTNLNPLEEQRMEKYIKELKGSYNREQSVQDKDDILMFKKNVLNLIKKLSLSLHSLRIKDKLRREHDRIVHMFDRGPRNEHYKGESKGFCANNEETENKDDKVARNGFRPDDEESYHEDYGEDKSEDYKGTIQIIMPDGEESKNESDKGVSEGLRLNGEKSGTEDDKVTSSQATSEKLNGGSEGKNEGHQPHNETLPNEDYKVGNTSKGSQSQTEDFNGTNNSYWLNNDNVKVDETFKSSHGVLKHEEDPEVEKRQEAIKGNSVKSQTEYEKFTLKSYKRRKLMNPYYYTTKNKKIKKQVKDHIKME